MAGSSPRQRAILESLPPTLLYAVAKPSAPQELVEKVKNGEVSTNKAYQDLLKENQQLRTDRVNAMNQAEREKSRADAAEAQRDAAQADVTGLYEQNTRLKEQVDAAEAREEEAWKLQGQAVQRAKTAEDALKKQPITGVVDKDEVKRQAEAMSRNAVQEARQQAAEAQAGCGSIRRTPKGCLPGTGLCPAGAVHCGQRAGHVPELVWQRRCRRRFAGPDGHPFVCRLRGDHVLAGRRKHHQPHCRRQ